MKHFISVFLVLLLIVLPACAEQTEFDRDFLSYVHAQNETENYIVSPLSFRAALILAVEGADASTRTQLLDAMGF